MHIFYAPDIELPEYILSEDESRHCVRVLRLRVADPVHLVDGRGGLYKGRIAEAGKRCVVAIEGVEREWGLRGYRLTMAVAPTKNPERYEWFLEKATEVGVDTFVPLVCEHSERRIFKPERACRVITSAVKQSLKAYHPDLQSLTPFAELVARPFEGVKLIAHCDDDAPRRYISDCVSRGDDVMVLIGPEGDFSPREIALAREHGFVGISLGDARLRTETAALEAAIEVAVVNRR